MGQSPKRDRAGIEGGAAALEAEAVTVRFGGSLVLDAVDLSVAAGASVALVGESGAGKTTLLRCFNRMVVPASGQVRVGGADVASRPVEILRRHIGYVPQQGGLLPHWTVLRNAGFLPTLLGRPDPRGDALSALERVGLDPAHFGARFPDALSGGQRQRVALARAIAARPGVLLLDEPFGALDAITRAEVQAAFVRLRAELGITTLLVTHDLAEAGRLADEIVVMRGGRIEQRASLDVLRLAPATPYVAELFERALPAEARP
jgi:osmoprotectant transport system ATP-binding protein